MLTEKSILHEIKIASILAMFSLVFFHIYDMRIVLAIGLMVVIAHALEVKEGYHVYQKGEVLLKILMLLVMGGMSIFGIGRFDASGDVALLRLYWGRK